VWECLKTVIDPELGVDIVSLGLIYKLQVTPQSAAQAGNKKQANRKVRILMTLTSPGCPLAGAFEGMVKESMRGIEGFDVEGDVDVELTFDPPWGLHLMSKEARVELGFE